MASDDENLLEELEGQVLVNHVSQSRFEADIIGEAEETEKSAIYPLDGRNLEYTSHQKKRKRSGRLDTAEFPKVEKIVVTKRTETSEEETTFFEIDGKKFSCSTNLWNKLYDFQKIGVQFLLSKFQANTGGLLADEMGLGKSVQVVAFIHSLLLTLEPNIFINDPILIICPTTLVGHWENEFERWTASTARPVCVTSNLDDLLELQSRKKKFRQKNHNLYIVSYEMFRARFSSGCGAAKFSVVVLDEAQRIRNPNSKITLAVKQLNCACRFALSGSPIQNNLSELWSIFDFVAPGRLGTLPTFQEELAIPIEDGTKPKASHQQIQLSHRCAVIVRDLTSPLMLRRVKSEYATQLALSEKEEQVLFCQLSPEQLDVYCKFLTTESVKSVLQQKGKSAGMTFYCLSVLRRIANHPDLLLDEDRTSLEDFGDASRSGKLGVLVPLLKLWQKQKKKCLIFSQSLGMLDILELTLRNLDLSFARMDGSTPMNTRNRLIDQFDASKSSCVENFGISCLLLSTKVGGVGLNLTAAERVVIFDPDWNPMTDAQARERSWRIGQKKTVKIYRLIAADTVEEIICKRQIYQHHLAQKILLDPRQAAASRLGGWDNVTDLFKAPLTAVSSSHKQQHSKSTAAILKILETPSLRKEQHILDEPSKEERESLDDYKSLITKVWNQDEIEMPSLCGSLVDAAETDAAASKAVKAVLAESQGLQNRDITVPTWTGKSGGGEADHQAAVTTSAQRSQSLVSKLRAGTPEIPSSHRPLIKHTFESENLIIEKSVVRELLAFFQKRDKYSAETDLILKNFAKKFSNGQSEIFRSSLRELCEFDGTVWTLKRAHR